MPKAGNLKVYRTPIGFHDAYVAAPSQKAALEAWGSSHNLFARGVAEIVTDEALTKEPLANPGKVIKRSRGSTAEQIAALPAAKSKSNARHAPEEDKPTRASPKRASKPKPRPSHDAVEAAEGEIAKLQDRHAEVDREIAAEQAALDSRRVDTEKAQQAEIAKAQRAYDLAEEKYLAALKKWRG